MNKEQYTIKKLGNLTNQINYKNVKSGATVEAQRKQSALSMRITLDYPIINTKKIN